MTRPASREGGIEVVRGRLDDDRAAQLVDLWRRTGALDEARARERLPEVVCVLVDGDGRLVASNSAHPVDLDLIGGRRFWVYRALLLPEAADAGDAMFRAVFGALEAEFDGGADAPLGICLLVADRREMQRRPDAEWSDPRTFYAGYLGGRQVRIAYFTGARIGP